jgi:hypothetical protein
MKDLVPLLLLGLAFSGCLGAGNGERDGDGSGDEDPGPIQLFGYIFDNALAPLEGAVVKILETNSSVTTDDEGFYAFAGLPTDQFLVIVATHDGFKPDSKQATLPQDMVVLLNFSLEPEPVKVPRMVPLSKAGFFSCQAGYAIGEENQTIDCSGGQAQTNVWDFAVDPDLAGAVIEIYWEPVSAAAETLHARLETLELGQFNEVLGEKTGASILRIDVAEAKARKLYVGGGLMQLTLTALPDNDANEAGIGAAAHVQQDFTMYASLFYVEPPCPSYTIDGGPCE